MGFLRKLAGFLGTSKDDVDAKNHHHHLSPPTARPPTAGAGDGGFAGKVPVAVERPSLGPLIVPCDLGDGGVQGFKWYTFKLRIDEDGDVADEFLEEIIPSFQTTNNKVGPPKLQRKYTTQTTAMAMKKQIIVVDGNICQTLEYQGRLQWV